MLVDPSHRRRGFTDFTVAFWVVTAISALATIWNSRFAPDAGDALSGRKALSDRESDG